MQRGVAMIAFTLHGLRLVSLANLREHWTTRSTRARKHRGEAYDAARLSRVGCVPTLPMVVTITRIAPRELDTDNLAISAKSVRDGIADALGVDDKDKRVTWLYTQSRGAPKAYAVRVDIECMGDVACPPPKPKTRTKKRAKSGLSALAKVARGPALAALRREMGG